MSELWDQFGDACESVHHKTVDYSAENVVEWLRGDKTVTVTLANNTKLCSKIKEYAKDYPDEVKITYENSDGSIVANIPLTYVKLSRPPKRNLTEEQKKALCERMKNMRSK